MWMAIDLARLPDLVVAVPHLTLLAAILFSPPPLTLRTRFGERNCGEMVGLQRNFVRILIFAFYNFIDLYLHQKQPATLSKLH
jgi:hypothetical protein